MDTNKNSAIDEYASALRQGQKEYRELLTAGKDPHPAVLDEILCLACRIAWNISSNFS